jgi:hypothetical protein
MPWPAWPPVSGLPPLSAVAALPSPRDSTATPRRSSQQWHARDGPSTRRRSLHARTGRPGCQSRRLRARGVASRNHRSGPPGPLPDPSPSPRRAPGRPTAPPSGEPSFFTPQGAYLRFQYSKIRSSCRLLPARILQASADLGETSDSGGPFGGRGCAAAASRHGSRLTPFPRPRSRPPNDSNVLNG